MVITIQALLLLLCIFGSSFFAGSETGFVSWNPLKIKHRQASGDIVARWALFLMQHKDRLISAVLIGNNICVVGASLAFVSLFESIDHTVSWELTRLPSPESWLLTPFMVLFGEMLPKSLFRIYPFRLTMRSIPVLTGLYFITLPFTYVFTFMMGLLRKNPIKRGETFMAKVREEMVLVAVEGSRVGTLFRFADIFIQNVLAMNEKRVGDAVQSVDGQRAPMISLGFRANETVGSVKKRVPDQSSLLVFEEDGDRLCGYVPLLELVTTTDDTPIGTLCRRLPQLETNQSVLTAIRSVDELEDSFYSIVDESGKPKGITDTVALLRGAFHNSSENND